MNPIAKWNDLCLASEFRESIEYRHDCLYSYITNAADQTNVRKIQLKKGNSEKIKDINLRKKKK